MELTSHGKGENGSWSFTVGVGLGICLGGSEEARRGGAAWRACSQGMLTGAQPPPHQFAADAHACASLLQVCCVGKLCTPDQEEFSCREVAGRLATGLVRRMCGWQHLWNALRFLPSKPAAVLKNLGYTKVFQRKAKFDKNTRRFFSSFLDWLIKRNALATSERD